MASRYADTESTQKTQTETPWKAQLMKGWLANRKHIDDETKSSVRQMGWVLETKRVGVSEAGNNLFQSVVLDGKGAVIHAFSVEEETDSV